MNTPCAQCVILVGGQGARLGEAVQHTPKPMLDIGGEPFLTHLIREIERFGFSRFLLLAGYRKEVIEEYFTRLDILMPQGISVTIMPEPEPLGTGGALLAAAPGLDDGFLLCNGDSLCLCNLLPLMKPFHSSGTLARLALMPIEHNERYGEVLVEGGFISGFRERSSGNKPGLMNAGIYFMRKSILEAFPIGKSSLEKDVFPALAAKRLLEFHVVEPNFFIDIGIPEDLRRAALEIPEALRRLNLKHELSI